MQEQESIERRYARALVAEHHGTHAGDKRCLRGCVGEDGAVIARVGLRYGGVAVGMSLEVETATVYNHAAEGRAVAAEEFCGRMYHDVGAVLDRAAEVGGGESVVYDEECSVAVGCGGDGVEVGDVAVGVAEGLAIDYLGVGAYGLGESVGIVEIDNCVGDTARGKGVDNKIIRATIEIVGRHYMVAGLKHILKSVGHRRRSGGKGESTCAAFEGCDTPLKHFLRRVGEASVDIAVFFKGEAVGGLTAIVEEVSRCLIYRYSPCSGRGCVAFLTGMELEGFEV